MNLKRNQSKIEECYANFNKLRSTTLNNSDEIISGKEMSKLVVNIENTMPSII